MMIDNGLLLFIALCLFHIATCTMSTHWNTRTRNTATAVNSTDATATDAAMSEHVCRYVYHCFQYLDLVLGLVLVKGNELVRENELVIQ